MKTVFYGCGDVFSGAILKRLEGLTRVVSVVKDEGGSRWHDEKDGAELGVVASYGSKLSEREMERFRHGVLNLHPSLLPRYRGAAPAEWQLLRRERQGGVTGIRINGRIDAGSIVAVERFDIDPLVITRNQLLQKASLLAADIVERIVGNVSLMDAGMPQDESLVTRAPKVTRELTMVNWETWTLEELACRLNALGERFGGLQISPNIKLIGIGRLHAGEHAEPERRFFKKDNFIAAQLKDGWVEMKRFNAGKVLNLNATSLWNGRMAEILAHVPPTIKTKS